MADIGSFLQPSQPVPTPSGQPQAQAPTQDTQPTDLKGQWDSWLQNPVNRNGLLAFGTSLMMGSWGNPLANSLAAGVESAAGTEQVQNNEAIRNQSRNDELSQFGQKREEAGLDRQNRLDVAKIGADSRTQIAANRQNNQLGTQEKIHYRTAYNKTLESLRNNNILLPPDQQLSEEDMAAQAMAQGEAAVSNYRSIFGSDAGPTSQANSGAPGAAGTTPAAGQTPAGGVPRAAGAAAQKGPSYSDIVAKYGADRVDALLADPQRRQQFESQFGKVQAVPASKGQVPANPSFKGTEDGTQKAPFSSREKAGAGQWYKDAQGNAKRKGLFQGLE